MIIGLIVGALAKLVMPGRDPGEIFVTLAAVRLLDRYRAIFRQAAWPVRT
jgi:hypothetical protein